jgi:threonyl-tRNA synthetase
VVIPVSEKFMSYAEKAGEALSAAGIRCRIDRRDEKVGYKIRDAENRKIPVMLVAGEEEAAADSVSVRRRKLGDLGRRGLEETVKELRREIDEKRLPPNPGEKK